MVQECNSWEQVTDWMPHALGCRLMNAETKLNAAVHSDEDIEQRLERLEMQLSIEPPQQESGTYLKTDYIIELRYRKDQWGDTCNSLSKGVAIIGAVSFFTGIFLFLRQMGWINPVTVPSTWPFCVWCLCCAPVCLIIHIGFEYNPTALGGVYLSSEGLESALKGYLSMKGQTTQAGYLDAVAIYNHELRKVVRRYRIICFTIGVCSMAFMIACFAYAFHYMTEDRYPETVSGQLNEASLGNTWMLLGAIQVCVSVSVSVSVSVFVSGLHGFIWLCPWLCLRLCPLFPICLLNCRSICLGHPQFFEWTLLAVRLNSRITSR